MNASRRSRLRLLSIAAAAVVSIIGVSPVRAELLPPVECQKLDTERQALMVLGIATYIERGPDWAKTNLTVADLDLIKRYFHIFEQLKFRCQEEIALIEVDEPDTEEQEGPTAGVPPMPERRVRTQDQSAASVVPAFTSSTTQIEKTIEKNTTSIPKLPRRPATQ